MTDLAAYYRRLRIAWAQHRRRYPGGPASGRYGMHNDRKAERRDAMTDIVFQAGKEYRTRDGRRARVYATDGTQSWPLHGAVYDGAEWMSTTWATDGKQVYGQECPNDLMPPEPAKERFLLWGAPSETGRDTVLEVEIQPDGTLKAVR